MSPDTWGKITDEETEKISKRIAQWRPQKPYWRDCTRDAFRSVARAVGNTNPLFQDEDYAANSRWGGMIAFPMFIISSFRFEGFGTGAPGFPGVHAIHSSGIWRLYRPIKLGDNILGKGSLWEQTLQPSKFAGKMLDQIGRDTCIDQKTGEVVADGFHLEKRWERTAASERRESGKGLYSGWKRWVYTDEELEIVKEDFARIEIRGATPRYWEDVKVGENLSPLIIAPYTGREIVAFYMGYGAPFVMSNAVLFDYFRRHPGLNVADKATKTPDVPERTHYEKELAQATGAPDMFDVTHPRFCWGASMVTNWMGDDAVLRELSCVARRFNAYGDVTWINGQVKEKYRAGDENLVKIALVWDNQRHRHSWGHALVSLPSRERGPVKLPPAPRDPERQPYAKMPDDVRSVIYGPDPGLPYGGRFKRQQETQ
jgi:acyl dehydratase